MRLVSALLDYYGHFLRRIIFHFRRYGISLRFRSILLVIALILIVLIPGFSLAEHFRAKCITVFFIVLLEAGSYIPTINACIYRALASKDRVGFRVSSSFYLAASSLLLFTLAYFYLPASNPLSLRFLLILFIFFFFLFLFSVLFFFFFFVLVFFFSSGVKRMIVLHTSRVFLSLVYIIASNFITFSGNVISSSILLLIDPSLISTIETWLGRFLVNHSSFSSSTSLVTSNNIGLESSGPQAPIWSELPADMIGEIGNHIPNSKDIKAILKFCNPCNSACFETTSWSLFPWLMLSNKLDSDLQCFLNLCNNKYLWLELPTSDQKRCWGSPHGLVVTLGPDYEAYLVHVRKEDQIALPPLNQIRALAPTAEWFFLVHKFIILNDPSHVELFLVFAIFGPLNRLAFARVTFNRGGDVAVLNRRGQGQWAIVANPDNFKFNDVTSYEDQIYAHCDNVILGCLELDAPTAAKVRVIVPQPSEEEIGTPQKVYLMKSQQNLIAVFRYRCHTPSKMRYETISFLVYRFNFSALNWEETNLEDCAAFVGEGTSWCIPTSTIPCRSNCIYFTDDNWELQRYPGVAYGGRDVGVFNIARRVIEQLPSHKDNPRFYSRPIWFTPSYYAFR